MVGWGGSAATDFRSCQLPAWDLLSWSIHIVLAYRELLGVCPSKTWISIATNAAMKDLGKMHVYRVVFLAVYSTVKLQFFSVVSSLDKKHIVNDKVWVEPNRQMFSIVCKRSKPHSVASKPK